MTQTSKLHFYTATTLGITVTVTPHFLEEQSSDFDSTYVWAYIVKIDNHSSQTIKLLDRHWEITDDLGYTQIIDGKGVIGEQPTLLPGESYEYASGTPLSTPSGLMLGYYTMKKLDDETVVKIDIPTFSLDSHYATRVLN